MCEMCDHIPVIVSLLSAKIIAANDASCTSLQATSSSTTSLCKVRSRVGIVDPYLFLFLDVLTCQQENEPRSRVAINNDFTTDLTLLPIIVVGQNPELLRLCVINRRIRALGSIVTPTVKALVYFPTEC